MNKKSNYTKIIVLVLALIVLGVAATYAYYTSSISGTPSQTSLESGKLYFNTNLESVSAINNTKLHLINAVDKNTQAEKVTFTAENTSNSTVSAKYYVYLKNVKLSKNLYSEYFKWELVQNGTVRSSGSFATASRSDAATTGEAENVITSANDIQLNTDALVIAPNTKDTVIFRMWLENSETENQIELTNGSFSGKLYLEAVPVSQNE